MSTPFATLALAVDIVRTDEDRMEARHRATGKILGTAVRTGLGWLIQCGHYYREIVISPDVAATVLRYLASRLAEATDRPVTP